MSAWDSIRKLYFDFQPAASHGQGCTRADSWDVTRHLDYGFCSETGHWDELREITLRLACPACGVIVFYTLKRQEGVNEFYQPSYTSAAAIGWGSAPRRVLGLWLHPGPPIWPGDERGPLSYYLTQAKERPRQPDDCVGVVGWHLGKRHGVKWGAGLHPTSDGTVERNSRDQDFATLHAAVRWITQELAAESEQAAGALAR